MHELTWQPTEHKTDPLAMMFDTSDDLKTIRNTDVRLARVKLVDLRDGVQGGEVVVNKVRTAVSILMLIAPLAKAYNGQVQFELGFAGSSAVGSDIIRTGQKYLESIGMSESGNTFARTMKAGGSPDHDPTCDPALTSAIQETLDAGIQSMTFVAKGTPTQAGQGLGLKNPWDHIGLVHNAFAYAHQNGITDLTLDPEHSFEALCSTDIHDRFFLVQMIMAAYAGGCRRIVLCDTNGDHTPQEIRAGLEWLHDLDAILTDDADKKLWAKIRDECEWGLHLHDDLAYAMASTMHALDSGYVDHLDMTSVESGERGGGNMQFLKWVCQMFQERGINVFEGNDEVWELIVATAQKIYFLMHRKTLRLREHHLGAFAAAQAAGMHTNTQTKGRGAQGETSRLYRPDAYEQENSVLDLLKQVETFALTRQAGKDNIRVNMEHMGLGEYVEERWRDCYEAINNDLNGDNGYICYTLHKASAAMRFWERCSGHETSDVLYVAETRVHASVKGEHGGTAEAMVKFETEDGGVEDWMGATSDKGILDAQFKALFGGLKKKNEDTEGLIDNVEIVGYHQDAIGEGSDARVITSITLQDTRTRESWAVSTVRASSFNSAYECMKEGLRYWILVKKGDLKHYQDPHLHFLHHLSTEQLIRELHDRVGLSGEDALRFLASVPNGDN